MPFAISQNYARFWTTSTSGEWRNRERVAIYSISAQNTTGLVELALTSDPYFESLTYLHILPKLLEEFEVFERCNGVPEWTLQVSRGSRWYSLLEFYRAVGALQVGLDLLTLLPVSFTPKKMSHTNFENFLTHILTLKKYPHASPFRIFSFKDFIKD